MFESLESRQLYSTALATSTIDPASEPAAPTAPVIDADADADAAARKASLSGITIRKRVDRASPLLAM